MSLFVPWALWLFPMVGSVCTQPIGIYQQPLKGNNPFIRDIKKKTGSHYVTLTDMEFTM